MKKERRDSDVARTSLLNPQSLEQLGPVQKMAFTFNGFYMQRDL
jgi:hypothetical protein